MAKVENMGMMRMIEVLSNLNPTANFVSIEVNHILVTGIKIEEIKCPEGYYLSEKNGITNKHNTKSGRYETFQLV